MEADLFLVLMHGAVFCVFLFSIVIMLAEYMICSVFLLQLQQQEEEFLEISQFNHAGITFNQVGWIFFISLN